MIQDLRVGCLIQIEKSGSTRLLRVVQLSDDRCVAAVLDVSGQFPTRSSRMPSVVPLAALPGFEVVDERLRTPEMCKPDSALAVEAKSARDTKYAVIEDLVRPEKLLGSVLDGSKRAQTLRDHAKKSGVRLSLIYRYLTRYWWFGCDRNALLNLLSLRGGRGRSRLGGEKKKGRRSAATKEFGVGAHTGRNLRPRDLVIFEKAIRKEYVKNNLSLRRTYEKLPKYYVAYTRGPDGKKRSYRIDPANIPTWDQFYPRAREIIRSLDLYAQKLGDHDWSMNFKSRPGSASDIVLGPTDVYDMDGGDLKCEMVSDDARRQSCGLASAIFVVDRGSGAVLGFHDYIGKEKWDHYRLALFWSLTDGREHLSSIGSQYATEYLGVHPLSGPCNGVYVDRGSARCKAAMYSLVDELKLERAIAPTSRPDLKSPVETVIGIFQRRIAELPGGYTRQSGERNKAIAKDAKARAQATERQIIENLIAAREEYNSSHDVSHLLRKEMIDDGVLPVPAELFAWGQKHIQGQISHHLTKQMLYFKLLPSRDARVYKDGVRDEGVFCSPELVRYREGRLKNKALKIRVHRDGVDADRRYWQLPSGDIGILYRKDAERRKFDSMGENSRARQLQWEAAHLKVIEIKRRRRGLVTHRQEETLRENAGLGKRKKRAASGLSSKESRELEGLRLGDRDRRVSRDILQSSELRSVPPKSAIPPDAPEVEPPATSAADEVFAKRFKRRSNPE